VSLLTDFDAFVTESHRGCGDLGARRPESLYAARAVRTVPDSRLRARSWGSPGGVLVMLVGWASLVCRIHGGGADPVAGRGVGRITAPPCVTARLIRVNERYISGDIINTRLDIEIRESAAQAWPQENPHDIERPTPGRLRCAA
jgi:hypothetical protein